MRETSNKKRTSQPKVRHLHAPRNRSCGSDTLHGTEAAAHTYIHTHIHISKGSKESNEYRMMGKEQLRPGFASRSTPRSQPKLRHSYCSCLHRNQSCGSAKRCCLTQNEQMSHRDVMNNESSFSGAATQNDLLQALAY